MPQTKICIALATLVIAAGIALTVADAPAASPSLAVGPQYDTTHVLLRQKSLTASLKVLSRPSAGPNRKRL
jgi:hypothetical protein